MKSNDHVRLGSNTLDSAATRERGMQNNAQVSFVTDFDLARVQHAVTFFAGPGAFPSVCSPRRSILASLPPPFLFFPAASVPPRGDVVVDRRVRIFVHRRPEFADKKKAHV